MMSSELHVKLATVKGFWKLENNLCISHYFCSVIPNICKIHIKYMVALITFHFRDKILEYINLEGGKVYFGSWSQSLWFLCLWQGTRTMIGRQEAEKDWALWLTASFCFVPLGSPTGGFCILSGQVSPLSCCSKVSWLWKHSHTPLEVHFTDLLGMIQNN